MKVHVAVGAWLGLALALIARGPAGAADPPMPEARASGSLAERLAQHPIEHPGAMPRERLFLMDIASGAATPVVDEPVPGSIFCGSPCWSQDGRRVLFDSYPPTDLTLSHIWSIDLAGAPGTAQDLGPGNCPTIAPDGRRIAFLSNAKGSQRGVYVMNADGTGRAYLGSYGRPHWSPDGKQILIGSFSIPRSVSLMDAETGKIRPVQLADQKFYDTPTWAGPGTIVAVIGDDGPDTVALIDVTRPEKVQVEIELRGAGDQVVIDTRSLGGPAKVKEVLWKQGDGPGIIAGFPIYHAGTKRCVFVDRQPKAEHLVTVVASDPTPPKRLELQGFNSSMTDIAFSPDGRYVLFNSKHSPDGPAR